MREATYQNSSAGIPAPLAQTAPHRKQMRRKNRPAAGPIWPLALAALCWRCLGQAAPIKPDIAAATNAAASYPSVQPPGASCILGESLQFKSPLKPPKIKLNANKSIQMTRAASRARQAAHESPSSSSSSPSLTASQLHFETICDGWENSITSSRAFWLLDRPRRALIAKFFYKNKVEFYDHPEAKLTSPVFPSIPLLHSMEDSKYYESCRLYFSIYSTIPSSIGVQLAPIQSVVAGSDHLPVPSFTQLDTGSYVIDIKQADKNQRTAEKYGEASVWTMHEIILPKSKVSNKSLPAPQPYKIEFIAMPNRLTSAETVDAHYLVGIALSNISLSPECFGLNIDQLELSRLSKMELQALQLNGPKHTYTEQLERFFRDYKLLLFSLVIILSAISMFYCTLIGTLSRPRERKPRKRHRIYVAPEAHLRETQIMEKHQLHPMPLSVIENVELQENPNYASIEHAICEPNDNRLEYSNLPTSSDTNYIVSYEPDEWEIDRAKVQLIRQIGTGAFGMVYLGELLAEEGGRGKKCAVKTLPETATLRQRMDFLREASIMKQFNTFHVVRLLGMVSVDNPVFVIMEYMENGDLKSYLRKVREFYQREQKTLVDGIYLMAAQIADGMAYLASKRFVHRDLAARNCMVNESGAVKVGDFGLTRDVYANEYHRRGTQGRLPVRWMAPESLLDNVYTSASDVWSYGVVVWEIVTFSAYPYQGLSNDEVIQRVCAGFNMSRPDNCPRKLYNLMRRCWRREPQERPTFCELLEELLPETEDQLYPNYFYRSRSTLMAADETQLLASSEPDNSSRAESYPMISDDRKPLVALYPVVH